MEVLFGHQSAAEEQSDYRQRIEYLNDHCDFSSGQLPNLYPDGRIIADNI